MNEFNPQSKRQPGLAAKHRVFRSLCAGVLCSGFVLSASAQEAPVPPDLPTTRQAADWIEQTPNVAKARSALEAAGYAGRAIAASPHEWVAKVQGQRRNYRDTGANSREWLAQLERTIRVNGKADLDRQLGETEQEIARARLGEARHEAARSLAADWLDVLASSRLQALFAEQEGFARENLRAVERRRRAGDASMLDVNVATADLGEVQRQASAIDTQFAKARARLRVRYAGASPGEGVLSDPPLAPLAEGAWRERVMTQSDPIRTAESQWRRAQLSAARSRADRVPDPTIGVFTTSEALANERVVGLSITIPLSGTYREQRMLQSLRESDAARAGLEAQRREIEVEAAETYAEALGSRTRWQVAEQAATVARDSARLMQRAYTLGEADLQALLQARRQALDAQRAALEARADALRWYHRLLIDAHMIWGLADD